MTKMPARAEDEQRKPSKPGTCGARWTRVATMKAKKIPTLPNSAVGFLCQRSARGLATTVEATGDGRGR